MIGHHIVNFGSTLSVSSQMQHMYLSGRKRIQGTVGLQEALCLREVAEDAAEGIVSHQQKKPTQLWWHQTVKLVQLKLKYPEEGIVSRVDDPLHGTASTSDAPLSIAWRCTRSHPHECEQVSDEGPPCCGYLRSINWTPAIDRGTNPVITITFSMTDGQTCDQRADCTDGKRRSITLRPQEPHEALQAQRQRQAPSEFKHDGAQRTGVEGIIAQRVRRCGIRRTCYVGLPKTRLHHLATASALNIICLADWLDEKPRAKTRCSAFARLMRQAA